jgi:glycosyltransferase involved in cell wall biosynthesis
MKVSDVLPSDSIPSQTLESLPGKRVAMVLFSYYPADPRPRRAAEALASCGMSVDLICLRESGKDLKKEAVNGVQIRRVPIARRRGGVFGYFYQYLAFLVASSSIIAVRSLSQRYDLVYVHNMPDFLVLSGLVPKIFGARVVLDLHDPMPELMRTIFGFPADSTVVRLLEFVEKQSIRLADAVVTVNKACVKLFASRSCTAEKITVVMNSPDEAIFKPRAPKARPLEKPFVLMYHGSLVERNGLGLAVEAFSKAKPFIPNAELRIYGSKNPFLEEVMASVRTLELEDSVHYMGPKPLDQIVKAIEECDLGLIPNKKSIFTEINTPTRIFEYLAMGKPVVAPSSPGICDYFDEKSLLYFELGSADDLAQKIVDIFHRPDEALEMARRGQDVYRAHSWREERLMLINVVGKLLSGPGESPLDSAKERKLSTRPVESQDRVQGA